MTFLVVIGTTLLAQDSMKALRQKATDRPRPIILNNDGNEPVYLMGEATSGKLQHHRTTPLAEPSGPNHALHRVRTAEPVWQGY